MKISEIRDLLDAEVLCGDDLERDILSACGSYMMSAVLAYVKNQAVLLTGLVNPQVIRTAVMMDMTCIVFVRSKKPTEAMISMAEDDGIVMMTSDMRMYNACGTLYTNGLIGTASHV